MQDNKAKMKALQSLMEMMDGHRLGKLKKKGQPAVTEVTVEKMDAAPIKVLGDQQSDAAQDKDEMEAELLAKLVDMYSDESKPSDDGDDDDKKKENLEIDGFVPMG